MPIAWRVSLALLLCSCGRQSDEALNAQWSDAAQNATVAQLQMQVADLQKQDDFQDNELVALVQDNGNLHKQVDANANIANANDKIHTARWDAVKGRLGL